MALGQGFLGALWLHPVNIITLLLHVSDGGLSKSPLATAVSKIYLSSPPQINKGERWREWAKGHVKWWVLELVVFNFHILLPELIVHVVHV